jgi:hypothetical protein
MSPLFAEADPRANTRLIPGGLVLVTDKCRHSTSPACSVAIGRLGGSPRAGLVRASGVAVVTSGDVYAFLSQHGY